MRMKIILREAVPKLGDAGDVVTVAGGYARNYLLPRGLAVAATKGNLRHAETWRTSRTAREGRERAQAEELKTVLESKPLVVTAQAGPDGRLFGSVTAAQVAEAIAAASGTQIDRHAIELAEPIRHLGMHEVRIPIYGDVEAQVTVEVVEGPAT
ncbi:MAG TPA: 50S ribosomal protein L9 [Actinomycetota bacterium]|nr:50S ribosomal protein L9 [Actinomycetota bacterium]